MKGDNSCVSFSKEIPISQKMLVVNYFQIGGKKFVDKYSMIHGHIDKKFDYFDTIMYNICVKN